MKWIKITITIAVWCQQKLVYVKYYINLKRWLIKINLHLLSENLNVFVDREELIPPVLDVLQVLVRMIRIVLPVNVFRDHDLTPGLQPLLQD